MKNASSFNHASAAQNASGASQDASNFIDASGASQNASSFNHASAAQNASATRESSASQNASSVHHASVAPEDVTDIALKSGELVLANGGETYRAEETMVGTAKALGAKSATAFVTPTVVMISFTDNQNRTHSAFRRIFTRVVNLRKLCQVNTLFRRLERREKLSKPALIESILKRISSANGYSAPFIVLFSAFGSLCFAFVFGGGIKEALCAFFAGLLLRLFLIWFEPLARNGFITSLCSGTLISVLSGFSVRFGFLASPLIVSTAVLMQVVPGLALVNAIRDIIAGDLVSGTARLVEACMIAVGLSIGAVFGLILV